MANPTTNYSFAMPTNTDLVKDLPADFEIFGQAVDTQMKTNADAAIAKTIVDAKGDIIAATAADTVARLAVGANDTVLTADSSTATGLKWASAAAGGMTLLETLTLTGASVTSSSIPSGYNYLTVFIKNFKPATDNTDLYMRYNSDSTANRYISRNTGASSTAFNTTVIMCNNNADNTADSTSFGWHNIYDYANTTIWKASFGVVYTRDGEFDTSKANVYPIIGLYNQTTAITTLQFLPSTGNFTSGTILIYGVK